MKKHFDIPIERTFGEILNDGFRFVIRNIGPMSKAFLMYVFPIMAAALVYMLYKDVMTSLLISATDPFSTGYFNSIIQFALIGIFIGLAVYLSNLIVYAGVRCYLEDGGVMTFDRLNENFKKYFWVYISSGIVQVIIIMVPMVFIGLVMYISGALGGLLAFIYFFVAIYLFNVYQFLGIVRIEEGLSIMDGLRRCNYIVKNQWWPIFGIIIVASIIGSILGSGFGIIASIISGVSSFFIMESGSTEDMSLINTFLIVSTFLNYLMRALINMCVSATRSFKYYDLIEKKEANSLVAAIENIGHKEDSFFENEGEF